MHQLRGKALSATAECAATKRAEAERDVPERAAAERQTSCAYCGRGRCGAQSGEQLCRCGCPVGCPVGQEHSCDVGGPPALRPTATNPSAYDPSANASNTAAAARVDGARSERDAVPAAPIAGVRARDH